MNRAKPINILLFTLLSTMALVLPFAPASAQRNGRDAQRVTQRLLEDANRSRSAKRVGEKPLIGKMDRLPRWVTQRRFSKDGRAPGDGQVPRQTILLTRANPSNQGALTPARSQNLTPFWTSDEALIFFASNRIDATAEGSGPNTRGPGGTGVYSIYRMLPDGTGILQITGSATDTTNTIDPALSADNSRMAYCAGGGVDPVSGLPTTGYNLFVLNLNNPSAPIALTSANPQNILFADVRSPTWSKGNEIAFSGRRAAPVADQTYHIFTVNLDTGRITQLTNGNANETAPAWSPDGNLIAFTSNAEGYTLTTPLTSTGTPRNFTNIWVISPNVFRPNPKRITGAGIPGVPPAPGVPANASNKNAAWSSLRTDPLQIVPRETDPGGNALGSRQMLAFASNRHDVGANRYTIYWMFADVRPDPNSPGTFTVTTPESAGNAPRALQTSTPDPAIDDTDPAASFNVNNQIDLDKPAWPQYISSYRIAFQSNRMVSNGQVVIGNFNLWASTIFDINAPSLLKYDIPNNQIVGVYRDTDPQLIGAGSSAYTGYTREFTAGERVRFRVRLVDYETGIESAYIQIKNPNSQPQAFDGVEHKTYFVGPGLLDQNTQVNNAPYELDCQAIHPTFYTFRPPGDPIPGWPSWNRYIASIDDELAFSGYLNPPDNDYWLRLWDDGPQSQGGHEPEGETANDGVYTNVWVTPVALPSDWYLDVIVRDNAINPFDTNVTTNWKIYDNVWGFTTQPFQANGGILYVNDYDSGQRFFNTRFGSGTGFSSFAGTPTESWMTEIDPAMIPTTYNIPPQPLVNFLTPLGINSYGGRGTFFPDALVDDGTNIPVTGRYAQWRILSRGPIPDSILNQYAATIQQQPPDVIGGGTNTRPVVVAERCVIWHAPYTGNLFVGSGTLLDTDTQRRITRFVQNGGRIFINGQDIAWALTLGGGGANPFLQQVLNVNYVTDSAGDTIIRPIRDKTINGQAVRGEGGSPISTQTWYDRPFLTYHNYPLFTGTPPYDPPSSGPMYLGTPNSGNPVRAYMAPNQASPDVVSYIGDASGARSPNVDADYENPAPPSPVLMWTTNATQNSKVVYAPFGFEGLNPESAALTGGGLALKNRRVELIHNILDYLRTGRIIGFVRDVNGSAPVPNVFIRAVDPRTNQTVATTYSLGDGSYTLSGLETTGVYILDAARPGFITQKTQGQLFHGGYQGRVDMFLTRLGPGNISGTVTRKTDGGPVAGAIVEAVSLADLNPDGSIRPDAPVYLGTSQTDGTYAISNVPPSDTIRYRVRVTNTTQLGFQGSEPPSYGGGEPGAATAVLVANNQGVPGIDFALLPKPGRVTGTVFGAAADGSNPQPLAGATVSASQGTGTPITTTTGQDGTYNLADLPPGTWSISASAPGYAPSAARDIVVVSDQTVADINFTLNAVPPGGLSGIVQTTRQAQQGRISGIPDVEIRVRGTADYNAPLITPLVRTGAVSNGNNYSVSGVPAGTTVYVTARRDGYNNGVETAFRAVQVQSGVTATGVDFTIDPLVSFSNTLSLVSTPNSYTTNILTLFGINANDPANRNFKFLTTTDGVTYIGYRQPTDPAPAPPADTFKRGVGYFLGNEGGSAMALVDPGQPIANPNAAFEIPLRRGWNLIGSPLVDATTKKPYPVNFLNLKVRTQAGAIVDVYSAQTGQNPLLGAALWTFDSGRYQFAYTIDPYRGYWLYAYQPLTLIVDPSARQDRSAKPNSYRADGRALMFGNGQGDGWKLELQAEAGELLSAPSYVGVRSGATDGFDRYKLLAPPKVGNYHVTLTFPHEDWGDKSGEYSADVRSTARTNQSWEFTVTSNIPNTPVTVRWPAVATVPGKYDLFLTDLETQQRVNLRTRASLTIPAATGAVNKRYRLEARRASRQTLQLVDLSARVNQSGGGRAPSSVGISYTLTAEATVQVSVLQNGRRIRLLEPNRSRAAGLSEVTWDLKSDQGLVVPSNAYTVEVRAVDSAGRVVRRVAPLLITR